MTVGGVSAAFPELGVDLVARFRTWKLEDGEPVVRLRGSHFKSRSDYKSDFPHAGRRGKGSIYVLIPHPRPGRLAAMIREFNNRLEVTETEGSVLVLGPDELIIELLIRGPTRCRGLIRRQLSPEQKARLRKQLPVPVPKPS